MTGLSREPPAAPIPARNAAGLGTIVGVWAHPHDETFLSAGLMALARAAGQRVVVVTATRGERQTAQPHRWPPERLGRLRADELAASLAVLGVAEHRWLDYADGSCGETAEGGPCGRLRRVFDEVRPDTVVTFGPDGLTGDPDHRAVSAWTTTAWRNTGRAATLLYAVPPDTTTGVAVDLRLDGAVLDRKVAALRAHASQAGNRGARVAAVRGGGAPATAWWRREAFRDATSTPVPAGTGDAPAGSSREAASSRVGASSRAGAGSPEGSGAERGRGCLDL